MAIYVQNITSGSVTITMCRVSLQPVSASSHTSFLANMAQFLHLIIRFLFFSVQYWETCFYLKRSDHAATLCYCTYMSVNIMTSFKSSASG